MPLRDLMKRAQRQFSIDRVAVTGGTGFLGRHLVKALRALGSDPLLLGRPLSQSEPTSEPRVVVDLTDLEGLTEVFVRERPRIIFHLAGTRGIRYENAWDTCLSVNVTGTVRLLEAAHRAQVERIVLIGSADEYGNRPGPLRETMTVAPVSPYATSKAAATAFAQAMFKRDGCPAVVLRTFTVFGPGQPITMFVREAIDCALREMPFSMTEGTQKRDLIYIDDAIDAFLAAATAPGIDGRLINVGSGQAHALRDVAQIIWRLTGTKAPLLIGARPASLTEIHDTWADIGRARKLLGWEPRVSLEAGLEAMIGWAKEQLAESERQCLAR